MSSGSKTNRQGPGLGTAPIPGSNFAAGSAIDQSHAAAAAVRRRMFLGATFAAGAAALAACTAPAANPTAGAVGPDESVTVPPEKPGDADLVVWADAKKAAAVAPVAAEFGTRWGIKVAVQTVGTNLQPNFITANQAGKGPDVLLAANDWIGNLVQNSAIDPVLISAEQRSAIAPIAMTAIEFNGQAYGVPYSMETLVLFRNQNLAPQAPASFEELVAIGQAARHSQGAERVLSLPVGTIGDAYHMQPVFSSAGGYIFGSAADGTPDPKDLGIGKPGSVEAAKLIAQYGETGNGVFSRSVTNDNYISLFTQGKIPFMVSGPWALTDVAKAGFPFATSLIPGFEGKAPAQPFVGVNAFYVASKARNKVFAQEFVRTILTSPQAQRQLYDANPLPPSLSALADEISAQDKNVATILQSAATGVPLPSIPAMNAVWAPLGNAFSSIIAGSAAESTIEQTGAAIRKAIG